MEEKEFPNVPWRPEQRACDAENPMTGFHCVRAPGHPGPHRSMSDGRWER